MWKMLLVLSLGVVTGVTGTIVSTRVTTHVAVALVQSCPAGDPDAGKTIDISGSPQGHILRLSK